ncbi:hypothetical protein F5887DRAFT_1156992 [Amanita rubescens]|nr:hypothetical protein F5887DRAFT_1156992 [Amanita rubescens]
MLPRPLHNLKWSSMSIRPHIYAIFYAAAKSMPACAQNAHFRVVNEAVGSLERRRDMITVGTILQWTRVIYLSINSQADKHTKKTVIKEMDSSTSLHRRLPVTWTYHFHCYNKLYAGALSMNKTQLRGRRVTPHNIPYLQSWSVMGRQYTRVQYMAFETRDDFGPVRGFRGEFAFARDSYPEFCKDESFGTMATSSPMHPTNSYLKDYNALVASHIGLPSRLGENEYYSSPLQMLLIHGDKSIEPKLVRPRQNDRIRQKFA